MYDRLLALLEPSGFSFSNEESLQRPSLAIFFLEKEIVCPQS